MNARSITNSVRPEIIVRYMDREQCLAWFGNVQMIFSLQPPTPHFMHRIIEELAALATVSHCGTGALLVIRSDVAPPSDEARAYIRRELSRSSMLAAAQVVEGTGFRGAAMRSVLSMLQLAVRPSYSMKIFDAIGPATLWLATELKAKAGTSPDGFTLSQSAKEIRSRFLTGSLPPLAPPGPVMRQ